MALTGPGSSCGRLTSAIYSHPKEFARIRRYAINNLYLALSEPAFVALLVAVGRETIIPTNPLSELPREILIHPQEPRRHVQAKCYGRPTVPLTPFVCVEMHDFGGFSPGCCLCTFALFSYVGEDSTVSETSARYFHLQHRKNARSEPPLWSEMRNLRSGMICKGRRADSQTRRQNPPASILRLLRLSSGTNLPRTGLYEISFYSHFS